MNRARRQVLLLAGLVVLVIAFMLLTEACQQKQTPPTIADTTTAQQISANDAGDGPIVSSYDGPMIRYRVAVAVHVLDNAQAVHARVSRQMAAAAPAERIGTLTESSFSVFSSELLSYLVPNLTMVLPENSTLEDGERLMRNHHYPDVGFYLVEQVRMHDIAFTVYSANPRQVSTDVDREGVLTDSLGKYKTTVNPYSTVFSYFGPVLSDSQILADRESIARAVGVNVSKVIVTPIIRTPSIPLKSTPHHH